MFLKNNQTDIYNEFNNYNKILNIEQIYEINLHLNQIQQKLFKN